jgi:hypothetical protein
MIFKRGNNNWLRRRWLDFRQGHAIYLVFIMTFANFITIQYKLLIDKLPVWNSLFDNIWIFAILFVAVYIPLSMIIGYWHRKSQWNVEAEAMFRENQIGATMWLFLIDMVDGKVTEEEKQKMRDMLLKIAKRSSSNIVPPSTNKQDINKSFSSEYETSQKEGIV